MRVAFHASRKRRMSSSVYGAAVHWSWFLRKICTTEQPTSRPRSRARWTPPAMDMWAPRRSGIERPLHRLELALEAPDLAAPLLASLPRREQLAVPHGEASPRELLRP